MGDLAQSLIEASNYGMARALLSRLHERTSPHRTGVRRPHRRRNPRAGALGADSPQTTAGGGARSNWQEVFRPHGAPSCWIWAAATAGS